MDDYDGYVDIHGSDDDSGGNVSPLPDVLLGVGRVADSAVTDEHSAAHEKLVIQTMSVPTCPIYPLHIGRLD